MITSTEKGLRKETDAIAIKIAAVERRIRVKTKLLSCGVLSDKKEELQWDVSLLVMQLTGLNDYMNKLQTIEHLIGSDD